MIWKKWFIDIIWCWWWCQLNQIVIKVAEMVGPLVSIHQVFIIVTFGASPDPNDVNKSSSRNTFSRSSSRNTFSRSISKNTYSGTSRNTDSVTTHWGRQQKRLPKPVWKNSKLVNLFFMEFTDESITMFLLNSWWNKLFQPLNKFYTEVKLVPYRSCLVSFSPKLWTLNGENLSNKVLFSI